MYEAKINLTPKLGINVTREKNYKPIFLMSMDAKIFNKSLADQIQQDITRIIHHEQDIKIITQLFQEQSWLALEHRSM